jgi:hypothetical protein
VKFDADAWMQAVRGRSACNNHTPGRAGRHHIAGRRCSHQWPQTQTQRAA